MRQLIVPIVVVVANSVLISGYFLLSPLTNTRYGLVKGKIEYSRGGRQYTSYRGIPFAKPPEGNLRFKAPEPPEPWKDNYTLDASKEGPVCIQKNYFFADPKIEGKEDCLYLNVYTPSNIRLAYLPVMVFIHWGGFFAGRGTSDYLSPEYFMDKDVIVVTFNYRLGIFGFLTTLDEVAPGNYALKDQRAALRWVQENIEYFGGDRERVTLFGQSAGGGSVHYHILSPLSKGLFQRAISQSGSALALWATPANSLQSGILAAQAATVNCSDYIGNSYEIINCLRNIPAEVLLETQDLFKMFGVDPLTIYTTVVENWTDTNPEPFFTKNPIEYIEAGEFHKVPWIIGGVEDEGIVKAEALVRQTALREKLDENFDSILSDLMYFSLSTADTQSLNNNVTEFYLQNKHYLDNRDPESIQGLVNLYSDRSFIYSSYQSILLHAGYGHHPIWVYNFDYRGEYTYGDLFAATDEPTDFKWGVSHCDDLLYLFKSPALIPPLEEQNDVEISCLMINLWTNFAIFGDPNPLENSALTIPWNTLNLDGLGDMKNENYCYLNIKGFYDSEISISNKCGFKAERMRFWTTQNLLENVQGIS